MAMPGNVGIKLLAVWLILSGCIGLFSISLGSLSPIMPLLALISGILILIGR